MLQIPDKEMEEKIARIQTSYRGLNAVIQNNIADSASAMAIYQDLNTSAYGTIGGKLQRVRPGALDFSKIYGGNDYSQEFVAQNYVLGQNVNQENEMLKERY